ncbi:TetR family transcriptional regulator C-terminal domain-containing protein [Amycolatopsis rhabdoformis]|uniref:TetR family transcriptional regulator C-terminal domain-containing protein n=1 Tax=Amycolatopsis rhabdoformis TaxID=1448059 RepID=A0ABZ1IDC0_9PSEU|nr:TetR family transcriptional regulator C-terminal domain-containing protein [Amycolatopsis rhabdoformis]WSE32435.1 TetR family transcriptional regulator C-terminal domain-containing protein [Amycolatopsis rhabdoformis]
MSGDQTGMRVEDAPEPHRLVVTAAIDLLRERQLGELTFADVRVASGVPEAQLRQAFESEDALFEAVVHAQVAGVLAAQEPLLAGVRSLSDLQAWRDNLVEENRVSGGAGGCPIGSLIGELAGRHDRGHRALVAGFATWEGLLAAAFRRIQENGELAPCTDPDTIATAVMGALQGGFLLSRTTRDPGRLATVLDVSLDHLRMLSPRSRSGPGSPLTPPSSSEVPG